MKLTDTIDKCETILSKRYETIEELLNHPEERLKLVFSDEYRKELIDEKNQLLEMLNNLKFIKFESNIQELDELIVKFVKKKKKVNDELIENVLKWTDKVLDGVDLNKKLPDEDT